MYFLYLETQTQSLSKIHFMKHTEESHIMNWDLVELSVNKTKYWKGSSHLQIDGRSPERPTEMNFGGERRLCGHLRLDRDSFNRTYMSILQWYSYGFSLQSNTRKVLQISLLRFCMQLTNLVSLNCDETAEDETDAICCVCEGDEERIQNCSQKAWSEQTTCEKEVTG